MAVFTKINKLDLSAIEKNFNLGNSVAKIKPTINIVDECPDGKEW